MHDFNYTKVCVNKNHIYKRECGRRRESGNEARYVLSGTNIHMPRPVYCLRGIFLLVIFSYDYTIKQVLQSCTSWGVCLTFGLRWGVGRI